MLTRACATGRQHRLSVSSAMRCFVPGLARLRGLPEGGRSNQRIADELAGVLEALADHYDRADRHGYAGILDPRRRPVRTRPATASMAT